MLLTGLFRAARKKLLTLDTDMGKFREKLDLLVEEKDKLSDEEISARVEEIKKYTEDLPDNDDKSAVLRFLEDFKAVKEQEKAVAKEAAKAVADMFEKLDAEAMADAPEEVTEETELVESSEPVTEEAEEITEETTAEDADPNAEYTLEEIYQFIKKRMAEDSAEEVEEDIEEEDIEDAECEEMEEEIISDHAPRIPVTVRGGANKGSLYALFNMAKGEI